METRAAKRKQAEEVAAQAPSVVETRARKAARIASHFKSEPAPAPVLTTAKRKQPVKKERATPRTKGEGALSKATPDEEPEGGCSGEPVPVESRLPEAAEAGPSQPAVSPRPERSAMDRSRREGRKSVAGDQGDANAQTGNEDQERLRDAQEAFGSRGLNASSALQGILRKLGAGFDDILPNAGMSNSSLKGILAQLRSDDEGLQLDGLSQLNELLAVSMEDSLSVFPVEQLVPVLIGLLQSDHNPDIMLLAARALTFLADVLPASCSSIVRHGAVPAFCERLLNIEYIDLAEQSLQALEKLSHEHPQACLRSGALLAVLSYLDFFQTGVQRVAVATAAHMCRGLTIDNTDAINSAVPILTSLLQYQDVKVVENACLALSRVAESLSHSPAHLETLCNYGLISNAVQLVAVSDSGGMTSQLSVSTYYGLIKLLTTCATGSHTVAENLLQGGISATVRKLLSSSNLFSTSQTSPGSVLRSSDQLYEVVSLACVLLPPLPDSSTMILEDQPTIATLSIQDEEPSNAQSSDILIRRRILADNPDLLEQFSRDVLPLLLQVYGATVVAQVKNKSLQTIIKILQYCPPELLRGLLLEISISSFIAALLTSRDAATLAVGVRLAELLMTKLPDIFNDMFLKEGVVHAMEQLSADAPSAPSARLEKAKPAKRSSSRLKGKDKEGKSRDAKMKGESPPEPAAPIASSTPPKTPGGPSLKQATAKRAQRFVTQYFNTASGGLGLETEGVKLLRDICQDFDKPGALARLLEVLHSSQSGDVSTFEFLSSGAVKQLRTYLLGEDLEGGERPQLLLQRLHSFTDAVMASGGAGSSGLLGLVRKLQDGLAAAENLPVLTSHVSITSSSVRFGGHRSVGDGSSLSSGLAALTQPFKLRLARAPHEQALRDYSGNVVLIEPLATMAAVEDFLWPRVYRSSAVAAAAEAAAAEGRAAAAEGNAGTKAEPAAGSQGADAKGAQAASEPLRWEGAGGERQPRRPASKVQPIPEARPSAAQQQRMTRSQASRAAQELLQGTGATPMETGDKAHIAPAQGTDKGGREDHPEDEDLIFLQGGGEVEVEGGHDDEDDDEDGEEEVPYDEEEDEELEEADLDGDEAMGLGRMHVHNVHLAEGATPEAAPEAAAAAAATAAATPAQEARAPPASQTYAQALAAGSAAAAAAAAQAGARSRTNAETRLRFSVGGHALETSHTIFQAIQEAHRAQQAAESGAQESDGGIPPRRRRLWEEVHTLHYSRHDNPAPEAESSGGAEGISAAGASTSGLGELESSPLSELLTVRIPQGLQVSQQASDLLVLLNVLEALNRLAGHLNLYLDSQAGKLDRKAVAYPGSPREEFVNSKLAPKLAQQLKDVLAICGGNLPAWTRQLVYNSKFLFPFDLRRRYFYCTASGLARALHHLQQQQAAEGAASTSSDSRELRVGRIQRSKVRISRKRILESAMKVMELYAHSRAVLELEYFNEAGTGLGPTLEFYTLLSHELQRKGLTMWRSDDGSTTEAAGAIVATKKDDGNSVRVEAALPTQADAAENAKSQAYVLAPQGLFPAPMSLSQQASASKVLDRFRLLGRAMAKALQDNRLLDIPLSYAFYRAALSRPLDLYNIRELDLSLGTSLEALYAAHRAWLATNKSQPLLVDSTPIEDLCLTFELPGYPDYELLPGGGDVAVTASNVGQYVDAVVNATLSEGIQAQMTAFRGGFEEVFSLDALKIFHEDELEAMLCGQGEKWTVEMLSDALKFDHGYTSSSTAIRHFLELLTELDAADQRRFLRFVTGSPRLPPGGLGALHPRLTVVRKHASSSNSDPKLGSSAGSLPGSFPGPGSLGRQVSMAADGDLPSVMTCANYIKLPAYSSKAVMQARLLFAIREGQGSFDLS